MRIILALCMLSISLVTAGCSSNVVPHDGPTMEQVYDSMPRQQETDMMSANDKSQLLDHRQVEYKGNAEMVSNVKETRTSHGFKKIPNPELAMYVFPHLSGKDEVPIPGYYTAFNVYTQDHYALPNETFRG